MAAFYRLPTHPAIISSDPISVTDIENPPAWAVITASIAAFRNAKSTLWDLPHLVEDLAYSLHENGNVDSRFLQKFLTSVYPDPSSIDSQAILNNIFDAALDLPNLFPKHEIPYLNISNVSIELNRNQVQALVAHQILGTLVPPHGNTWGSTFLCWYSEPQPHERAVHGYLTTAFLFFSHNLKIPYAPNQSVYEFHSLPTAVDTWETCNAFAFDHLILETVTNTSVKFPHETLTCMLVSSNTSPGFGSSSTQEELITGACPALLPLGALLVSPPIPSDAALLVRGVVPLTEWRGQGRDAHHVGVVDTDTEYTFLLLDALELDTTEPQGFLIDLVSSNIHRELQKAFIGFSALKNHGVSNIAAPLWGTGAFGGDPVVKAVILAMAEACTGIRVRLAVNDTWTYPSGPNSSPLCKILENLKKECARKTVAELWEILGADRTRRCLYGWEVAQLLTTS